MSSIRNITAATAVPDDLAKRLGPSGVNEILLILWQGYHDIIADTNITITENTEEDDITQEWYGKISLRWTAENRATILRINSIGPVHQYQDSTLKKERGYNLTEKKVLTAYIGDKKLDNSSESFNNIKASDRKSTRLNSSHT